MNAHQNLLRVIAKIERELGDHTQILKAPMMATAPSFPGQELAMSQWLEKCRRRLRDGKAAACDPPQTAAALIRPDLIKVTRMRLRKADDPEAVTSVFNDSGGGHPTDQRNDIEAGMAAAIADALADVASGINSTAAETLQALTADAHMLWSRLSQSLRSLLMLWLGRAAVVGVGEARTEPLFMPESPATAGIAWDLVNMNARQWAEQHAMSLASKLTQTTRSEVTAAIASWIEAGGALPDLVKDINDIIDDSDRAQLIAQTETTRAFARGNATAWKAMGVKARKWFTVKDERVCKKCGFLHGQVREMGQPFKDDEGNLIDDPGAHPGCRCYNQPHGGDDV